MSYKYSLALTLEVQMHNNYFNITDTSVNQDINCISRINVYRDST